MNDEMYKRIAEYCKFRNECLKSDDAKYAPMKEILLDVKDIVKPLFDEIDNYNNEKKQVFKKYHEKLFEHCLSVIRENITKCEINADYDDDQYEIHFEDVSGKFKYSLTYTIENWVSIASGRLFVHFVSDEDERNNKKAKEKKESMIHETYYAFKFDRESPNGINNILLNRLHKLHYMLMEYNIKKFDSISVDDSISELKAINFIDFGTELKNELMK